MTSKRSVFVATLETRSFSFMALGRTENEARAAMAEGWDAHRQELDGVDPWSVFEDGVNVTELSPGLCARDGSVINPH